MVDRLSTAFAGDSGVLEWVNLFCDVRVERQRPSRGDAAAGGMPPFSFSIAGEQSAVCVMLSACSRLVPCALVVQSNAVQLLLLSRNFAKAQLSGFDEQERRPTSEYR